MSTIYFDGGEWSYLRQRLTPYGDPGQIATAIMALVDGNRRAYIDSYGEISFNVDLNAVPTVPPSCVADTAAGHVAHIYYNCLSQRNDPATGFARDLAPPDAMAILQAAAERCDVEEARLAAIAATEERARRAAERAARCTAFPPPPPWAKSLIVAEEERNESDLQTDYHGSRTVRAVGLAWSKHERDVFSELRKAAATFGPTAHMGPGCDIYTVRVAFAAKVGMHAEGDWSHWHRDVTPEDTFPTWAAAEAWIAAHPAPCDVSDSGGEVCTFRYSVDCESYEHREKYSMGAGYYLGSSRYAGWKVRKVDVNRGQLGGYEIGPALVAPIARTARPVSAARTVTRPATTPDAPAATVTVRPSQVRAGNVEIVFPAKPDETVRAALKAAGFRWHGPGGCWYGRADRLPAGYKATA